MKLVKPGAFNTPSTMHVSLSHPQEQVLLYVAIVVLKDGRVDLVGHINDRAVAEQVIRDGMARLLQYHAKGVQVSVPESTITQ